MTNSNLMTLAVNRRQQERKSTLKQKRREGIIPGVCYSKISNDVIEYKKQDFFNIFKNCYYHIPFKLDINNGEDSFEVLVKKYDIEPLRKDIIHVDFIKILKGQKLRVEIPIDLKGMPKGLKKGGIQEQKLQRLRIESTIDFIPKSVVIDVSHLDVRDSIYVKSLKLEPEVKLLSPLSQLIVTISPSRATRLAEAEKQQQLKKGKKETKKS